MESLSETLWDVVIVGTGLQQSLLALALSRSDKKVLHIDPNQYYGGPEAAFSLQEVDDWVERQRRPEQTPAPSGGVSSPSASSSESSSKRAIFTSASVTRPTPPPGDHGGPALSFPRAYSLALAPQVIHSRSRLIAQLVSSRAFRQLEFLAVGSFFVLTQKPDPGLVDLDSSTPSSSSSPSLTRIPSTREDVFSDSSIPARAKRSLMKFLKFVLDYDSPPQTDLWQHQPDQEALTEFLERQFKLDADLRAFVLALTMAPDYGTVTTRDGLAAIHRHLTSMGVFGPGFAALYPKWGGAGEIAQVGCRAGAVGGGVYMLGTGAKNLGCREATGEEPGTVEVELTDGTTVKTKLVVQGWEDGKMEEEEENKSGSVDGSHGRVSRLIAVVGSPLPTLFESVVEGSPHPAVAVIACPPGSVGSNQQHPVYVLAHSSDTGECPSDQSILYLSTLSTPSSKEILDHALAHVVAALGTKAESDLKSPTCLYQLYYEQATGNPSSSGSGLFDIERGVFAFPLPSTALAFDDDILDPVQEAWKAVVGNTADVEEYMKFIDREGMGDDDGEDI